MTEVVQYETEEGASPFANWFDGLDAPAARKMLFVTARMEAGNLGHTRSVGEGVSERRIDWGPGYRTYFGRDGDLLIVLLAGGTKKRQTADLARAKAYWADHKRRSREC